MRSANLIHVWSTKDCPLFGSYYLGGTVTSRLLLAGILLDQHSKVNVATQCEWNAVTVSGPAIARNTRERERKVRCQKANLELRQPALSFERASDH